MRVAVVTIALLLTGIVSSCSGSSQDQPPKTDGIVDGPQATSDCSAQVRAGDVVYTSYGSTERGGVRHSVADQADCDDVGPDAAGSVFSERSKQVTTWSFRGYPPVEVVGVRSDQDSFAVFVADSVPDAERDRIFEELGQASSQ
ncbi:MAG: DUF6281 family protein [Nocardioides sp.]